jgi:para-nitrobenzyl esterase
MHVASPLGRDLFSRALSESGGTFASPLAKAEAMGTTYLSSLGCTGPNAIACARALPTASVTAAAAAFNGHWDPAIDGYVLTEPLVQTFAAGRQAHVPLMIGTNADEYAWGLDANPSVTTINSDGDYQAAIGQLFNAAVVPSILSRYPSASYASPRAAYIAVLTDTRMTCANRRVARAVSASQSQPVWRYLWAHGDSSGFFAPFGAAHAVDLPFRFNTLPTIKNLVPTAAEQALALSTMSFEAQFADTGDPNSARGPAMWPRYDAASDAYLLVKADTTMTPGFGPSICDFWDGLQASAPSDDGTQ